jgi:hypothetical protein
MKEHFGLEEDIMVVSFFLKRFPETNRISKKGTTVFFVQKHLIRILALLLSF